MLFNASQHLPAMTSLFPDTTMKHYAYLRDTMPEFVPQLICEQPTSNLILETQATGSKQFLETLLNNIQASSCLEHHKAWEALIEAAQENLARLAIIDPLLSGTANFTAEFLGAQLLMEQLQTSIFCSSRMPSKECMQRLIKKCLK